MQITIIMPMRWLAACMNNMKEYGWGYIYRGKVLEKLKEDLNVIVYQPESIHDEYFIMGIMDPRAEELPTLLEYLDQKMKQQKTNYFNST